VFSQEKNTPDILNGFKEFKFFKPITDYYEYIIKKNDNIKNMEDFSFCENYSVKNSQTKFLDADILESNIWVYKDKIVGISIKLNKSIWNVLNNMFESAFDVNTYVNSKYPNLKSGGLPQYYVDPDQMQATSLRMMLNDEQSFLHNFCKDYIFEDYKTNFTIGIPNIISSSVKKINGYNTQLMFKTKVIETCFYTLENSFYNTSVNKYKYIKSNKEKSKIESEYILTIKAFNYEEKFKKEQNEITKEHYDSYLSEFSSDYSIKENIKKEHIIPLIKSNNVFYIKANFGDVVSYFVFDTGASEMIISNKLYKELKNNNLVVDGKERLKFKIANGDIVEFEEVIVKSIQFHDLKASNIKAYVNPNEEISLLGQSFLQKFGGLSVDHKNNLLYIYRD